MAQICTGCGYKFDPKPNEEQLMKLGRRPVLCPKCTQRADPAIVSTEEKRRPHRQPNAVLCRVDVFEPNGKVHRWMSERVVPKAIMRADRRRAGRRGDIHVFVLSADSSKYFGVKQHKLRTNLAWFREKNQPLRFWKDPAVQEYMTGIDMIEIPIQDVGDVEDDKGLEATIRLINGGRIRMQYRN